MERRLKFRQEKNSRKAKVSSNRLKLLITIVSRSKADFYLDYIQSFGVNMQMVLFGHGTAPREIASAMGLADSERAILLSVIAENQLLPALEGLAEKFSTIAGGRGIAYTVPFSSLIGKSIFNFLSDNRNAARRKGK